MEHWGRRDDPLMVRFCATVPAPAAAVWDILRDGSRRKEIDDLLDSSEQLEVLSNLISIWQFDFKGVMMTAPRSFVTIGYSARLPADETAAERIGPPTPTPPTPTHTPTHTHTTHFLCEPHRPRTLSEFLSWQASSRAR